MDSLAPALSAAPIVALLACGLIPSRIANGRPLWMGWGTTILAAWSLVTAAAAAFVVATAGPIDAALVDWSAPVRFRLGIHIDSVAVVMTTLISFIGWVIARYSIQYLRGDPRQGGFFRWTSFTLGATLLLATSCNLVLFTAAWMLTSFGLHQLLTHYPERTWAVWAARKKFLISRLGDALLLAALFLAYRSFGTTEYTELFAAADAIHAGPAAATSATAWIGVLFVLGAMTKSAQFPFHSWLPDTMETPTPVSALMHAGVINAGGFLVIRLFPLVSLSPIALDLLALTGGVTALLGGVVMLTQTSVKRALAYSTIAQMGFMMLECGLGAIPAALLHIVAHSAYKAHAFLSCGSVIDAAARTQAPAATAPSRIRNAVALGGAFILAAGIVWGTQQATRGGFDGEPGGAVLSLVLTLGLTQLLWSGLSTASLGVSVRSMTAALLVAALYSAGSLAMERLVAESTSHHVAAPSLLDVVVLGLTSLGFIGVFALQAAAGPLAKQRWMQAAYVHAMNGFYIDIPARRLTAKIYAQTAPVQ